MTAVRGAAELARQRTCLGGTECQHEGGESKSSAGIWQHNPKRPYARLLLNFVLCCALELRVSCALASLRCARAPYIPARSHAEYSLDRSDSKEFLGCFFSFAGSPKYRLRAPGRRVCPLAVAIGGGVAPQWSLVQALIRRLRSVVAVCAASLPEMLLP